MITFLVNALILVVVAVVVFMITKYVLDQAEVDPPVRKITLLILLVVFVVALINLLSGGAIWGPMIVVRG